MKGLDIMKKRKAVVFLICTALASSTLFSGCGKSNKSVSSGKDYGDYPISTNVTLEFWSALDPNVSANYTNLGDTEFAKKLEELTGVKVKYTHPAAGQEYENFSILIASGDYPDMVQYDWKNAVGGPEGMINNEVIVPLNDLMDKNAPNLKKYLGENPDIDRRIKTDNGNYYVFPFIRSDKSLLISQGPIFRKDWLDDLGLSAPQTIEEWENVLTAFRDKKGAQAPLSVSPSTSKFLYFIFNTTPDFYVQDGKVKLGCAEPEFKEALIRLNKWFADGLIDKNYISTDSSMNTYNILNGVSGATFGGGGADLGKWLNSMKDKDAKFDLVGVKFPKAANGSENSFAPFNDFYASHGSVAITTNCKDADLAAKWLDFGYSEAGHMLNNFGIEGTSYTMKDNYPTYTETVTKNSEGLSFGQALSKYTRAAFCGPFIQDKRYIEQYYSLDQQKKALEQWSVSYDETFKKKLPPTIISGDDSSDYASWYNEIVKYRNETVAAFITGVKPFSEYDEYLNTLKQLKSDKVIEIQQKAYDKYMSR